MIKRLKYMPILWVMLLLASCGTAETENMDHAAIAEDLNNIRFTYKLNGGEADIRFWGDGESTYYYFLPSGNRLEPLEVGTQNGITLRKKEAPEESRITFKNGETLSGIECDTTYLLGCYDENGYLYEVPVKFMQGANVYSVFITTDEASIEPVLQDKEQKLKGDMLISDPEGNVVYQGRLTHIKGRGNGSWYSFKKPFNI